MLLELKHIHIPPGQRVLLQNVTWQEFEEILEELGEHRAARIAYDQEAGGTFGSSWQGEYFNSSPCVKVQAPKFIYGKKKIFISSGKCTEVAASLLQAPKFIYGVSPCQRCPRAKGASS